MRGVDMARTLRAQSASIKLHETKWASLGRRCAKTAGAESCGAFFFRVVARRTLAKRHGIRWAAASESKVQPPPKNPWQRTPA